MTETGQDRAPAPSRCHDPYNRCAFYGAAQTALGVTGSCVIAHSPQGCFQLVDAAFSWQDADYTETLTLSTKLCEDEIVHGGEDLLAQTIAEARELGTRLVFVLTACGPEIVGDDAVAVCEDVPNQEGFKIVPIECAGFRGDQNRGTDIALDAMLRHLVDHGAPREPGTVVLIAPHANSNPTWMGDLAWVQQVLHQMGATVVATLAHNTGVEDFERVAAAESCIVLSHDAGQRAADYLAREFGTVQLCRDVPLPVGFTNTRRWLAELGSSLDAAAVADSMAAQGESLVVEQCRRKGLEQFFMHRAPVGIVADSTVGIPLLRFVTEDLEMIPRVVCLRSGLPGAQQLLERELRELDLHPTVVQDTDVYRAKQALGGVPLEAVFGSNIERHAVEELDIPFVFRLSNPIARFRTVDREYFGYTGMLNLIESIQNDWQDRYRSDRRRYRARW